MAHYTSPKLSKSPSYSTEQLPKTRNEKNSTIWKENIVSAVCPDDKSKQKLNITLKIYERNKDTSDYETDSKDVLKTNGTGRRAVVVKKTKKIRNNVLLKETRITISTNSGYNSKQTKEMNNIPKLNIKPTVSYSALDLSIKKDEDEEKKDMLTMSNDTRLIVKEYNRHLKDGDSLKEMLQTLRFRRMVKEASQMLDRNKSKSELKVNKSAELFRTKSHFTKRIDESSEDSDDTARYIRSSRRSSTIFRLPPSFRRHCYMSKIKAYRQMRSGQKIETLEKNKAFERSDGDTSISRNSVVSNIDNNTLVKIMSRKKGSDKTLRSRKRKSRKRSYRTPCLETSEEEHESSTYSTISSRSKESVRTKLQYPKREPAVNSSQYAKPLTTTACRQRITDNFPKQLPTKSDENVLKTKEHKTNKKDNIDKRDNKIFNEKKDDDIFTTTSTINHELDSISKMIQDDKQSDRKRKNIEVKSDGILISCIPPMFITQRISPTTTKRLIKMQQYEMEKLKKPETIKVLSVDDVREVESKTGQRYAGPGGKRFIKLKPLPSNITCAIIPNFCDNNSTIIPLFESFSPEKPKSKVKAEDMESSNITNSSSWTQSPYLTRKKMDSPNFLYNKLIEEAPIPIGNGFTREPFNYINRKLKMEETNTMNSQLETEPFNIIAKSKFNTELSFDNSNNSTNYDTSTTFNNKLDTEQSGKEPLKLFNRKTRKEVNVYFNNRLPFAVNNMLKKEPNTSFTTEVHNTCMMKDEFNSINNSDNKSEYSTDGDDAITIYTPDMRSKLSKHKNNYESGYFDITEEYLSQFVGHKTAEKFFKSYIGRRRFPANSIIFFKPPSVTASDTSENGKSSLGSEFENDLEFIDESGYLYELGHQPDYLN